MPRVTTTARIALAALALVGGVETTRSVLAGQRTISTEDWSLARDAHHAPRPHHDEVPLLVADAWLEPEARMRIMAAADPDVVGRPDLIGVDAFDVLRTRQSAASSATRWDTEIAPFGQARRVNTVPAGELMLERWVVDGSARVVDRLTSGDVAVSLEGDVRRPCRGALDPDVRCRGEDGRIITIAQRFAEVDYTPRRCISMPVDDARDVSILRGTFQRGDRIVGHLGFEDFNARLRNAGPVTLELRVDGVLAGRHTFTPDQGWVPFELTTTRGVGRISVTIRAAAGGRWTSPPPTWREEQERRICLELRAVEVETP